VVFQLTQSRYDMLHDVLDEYDGAARLTSRLIVDLEPQQRAVSHHVLIHRIPRNTDTLWAEHFHLGIRYSRNSCKQAQQLN